MRTRLCARCSSLITSKDTSPRVERVCRIWNCAIARGENPLGLRRVAYLSDRVCAPPATHRCTPVLLLSYSLVTVLWKYRWRRSSVKRSFQFVCTVIFLTDYAESIDGRKVKEDRDESRDEFLLPFYTCLGLRKFDPRVSILNVYIIDERRTTRIGLYDFILVVEHTLLSPQCGIFTRLSKLRDFTTRWAYFLTARESANFDTRFPPLAETFRRHAHKIIFTVNIVFPRPSAFRAFVPPGNAVREFHGDALSREIFPVKFPFSFHRCSSSLPALSTLPCSSVPRTKPQEGGSNLRTRPESGRSNGD